MCIKQKNKSFYDNGAIDTQDFYEVNNDVLFPSYKTHMIPLGERCELTKIYTLQYECPLV